MDALLIQVTGLTKRLGGQPILNGVSFSVERGSSVVIQGASGSGKTTLLRCLNALERPDAGTIQIDDCQLDAARWPAEAALQNLRRKVGMVFQQWHLFANRTVLGNVIEAPIHSAHRPPSEVTAQAIALLDRVGIGHRAQAFPHNLSGGEQQRAAIARALAMQPSVLLLDEPSSALDGKRADDLLSLLNGLRETGLTLVTVTHDERVTRALGERVFSLEAGRFAAG